MVEFFGKSFNRNEQSNHKQKTRAKS